MSRRWIAVGCAWLGAAGGACVFSADSPPGRFRCGAGDVCPAGTTCVDGYCEAGATGADAATGCQLGAFAAAQVVGSLSTNIDDWGPMIGPDSLELFLYRPGEKVEIWRAARDSIADEFREAGRAFAAPPPGMDRDPFLAIDGRTLLFVTLRDGGMGGNDIYLATRPSPNEAFGDARPVPGVSANGEDRSPWLSDDLLRLYFASDRAGDFEIYLAERSDPTADFTTPQRVMSLNTVDHDRWISLTPDELEAFITSDRSGGSGMQDLYRCTRSTRSEPFGSCEELTLFNTPFDDVAAAPSRDGRELYMNIDTELDGGRDADIWRATRDCQ